MQYDGGVSDSLACREILDESGQFLHLIKDSCVRSDKVFCGEQPIYYCHIFEQSKHIHGDSWT